MKDCGESRGMSQIYGLAEIKSAAGLDKSACKCQPDKAVMRELRDMTLFRIAPQA